jgi:hypothetical protein
MWLVCAINSDEADEQDEHAHYGQVDCLTLTVLYPLEGEEQP